MVQRFTHFLSVASCFVNLIYLVLLGLITSCGGTDTPEPAVSFLGGYIGQVTATTNATSPQTYESLTVHIIKTNHPDSVMIDLLHRTKLFPNPLLAIVHPTKLVVYPQPSPIATHTLTGEATRTGDSLHITLTETGGNLPVMYQINASRLRD